MSDLDSFGPFSPCETDKVGYTNTMNTILTIGLVLSLGLGVLGWEVWQHVKLWRGQ